MIQLSSAVTLLVAEMSKRPTCFSDYPCQPHLLRPPAAARIHGRDSMSGSHLAGVLLGLLGALVVLVAVVTVIFKCRKRQSKCCWNQGRTTSRPASLPEVYAIPLDRRHLPRGEVQPDILQQIASLVQRSAPGEVNPAPACVVAGDTELPPPYSSLDLPPPYSSVVMKTAAEAEQRL